MDESGEGHHSPFQTSPPGRRIHNESEIRAGRMDSFEEQLSGFVKKSYVNQGLQNEQARKNLLQVLLRHKKLPKKGWNDQSIELLIHELSVMDSNNFMSNAGVGEREGRVYSQLVARRHYGLAHGVGRSGDIAEVQPKAAGSSIIYKLTNCLVTHAMEVAGISPGMEALVLPMATGMSLTLCFIAMKKQRPGAKYIIFPRIDQKSCFKAIMTAGLEPIIVENVMSAEGELCTDVEAVRAQLQLLGEEVLCVLCTTSCFAPRQPDSIDRVAVLCREFGVGHVVNNAYGLQCKAICKLINRAARLGTLTAVVQSTDKNFMVPVGGAVVFSPSPAFVAAVSASYPGRASAAPVLDLFITLLSMGEEGYRALLGERERLCGVVQIGLLELAAKHSLSLLPAPRNSISTALSLQSLTEVEASQGQEKGQEEGQEKGQEEGQEKGQGGAAQPEVTFLGSMLFQRCVSGCRVVECKGEVKTVAGHDFCDWGAHKSLYPQSYLTVACAVGMCEEDAVLFLQRLDKALLQFKKKSTRAASIAPAENT